MNPKNLQKYIDLAFLLYEENYEMRTQHFTFAVLKNRILTIGRNQKKSHSIHRRNPRICENGEKVTNKSICSEWAALSKIKNTMNVSFSKITLINVRINRLKKVANSNLCTSCRSLVRFLGVKKIYYTNNTGQFEKFE